MTASALEIIYRDDDYIAINKPSGLLAHTTIIDRHAAENARDVLERQIGQKPFLIHRLDKPASGVLLFGLSPEAARRGVAAFSAGAVRKTYVAVVRGYLASEQTIDSSLKQVRDKIMAGRERLNKPPRSATTRVRPLAGAELPVAVGRYRTARYSLVAVHPASGRRHQIRRHLKHVSHPVIGDTTYGDALHNRFFRSRWNVHRLLLAAVELEFTHPFAQTPLRIHAPLDAVFREVLEALSWVRAIPEAWL